MMTALLVDEPRLSAAEQRINYNVALPRDPAMVQAEAEWEAVLGPRDAKSGQRPYRMPRLTAEQALTVSSELAAGVTEARQEREPSVPARILVKLGYIRTVHGWFRPRR